MTRTQEQKKCLICNRLADKKFKRTEAWSDKRWRLTTTRYKQVRGLSYLEPRRHIGFLSDLNGKEAQEFGVVLSRVSRAIKAVTNAPIVYYYIFGDTIAHLHVHIAPHFPGDAFSENVVKETFDERKLCTMGPEKVSDLVERLKEAMD